MNSNKIQMALFQGRTRIMGLDPMPGVNERREHGDGR